MAENSRPPVAIRIVRPYDSEDALLEHELETIGKTSVILIGAHPRPTGVILRFEVTLASGNTVLRGEGRVLAHKENAFRGQPGLTLRFTRLDPRSKSVVDRATSMREARSHGDIGSPSRPPAIPQEGALADALTASTPMPAPTQTAPLLPTAPDSQPAQEDAVASARASAREKANATARANAKRTRPSVTPPSLTPPPPPVATAGAADEIPITEGVEEPPTPAPTPVTSVPGEVADRTIAPGPPDMTLRPAPPDMTLRPAAPNTIPPDEARTIAPSPPVARERRAPLVEPVARAAKVPSDGSGPHPLEPPPDRAELLARLRERAAKLPRERVEEILKRG